MRIDVRGVIIPNNYKRAYDYLDWENTCPKDIFDALEKAAGADVKVYISSGGGSLYAGMDIYSALKEYTGAVKILITSHAHSAASIIACAAESEIMLGAMVMVHRVSFGEYGNCEDMRRAANTLSAHDESICGLYMEKTGLSREEVLKLMAEETYMSAEKAVKLGFADTIAPDSRQLVASTVPMLTGEQVQKIMAIIGAEQSGKLDARIPLAKAKLKLLQLGGSK